MTYDPHMLGARCDVCVLLALREHPPVPPELHDGATMGFVAESPGHDDVKAGRPLVGAAGHELQRALDPIGVKRGHAHLFTAMACRAPSTLPMIKVRGQLARANRARKKAGETAWPDPVEACAERLRTELRATGCTDVVTLGRGAFTALTPMRGPLSSTQGALNPAVCLDGVSRRIVPAHHPAYVLRRPSWRGPFYNALRRAVLWFGGQLAWEEPRITYIGPAGWAPSGAAVTQDLDWLESWAAWWSTLPSAYYDVETDALEPLIANTRCVQLGTGDEVVVVWLRGIRGDEPWANPRDRARVVDLLHLMLVRAAPPLGGHNAGWYDRLNMHRLFTLHGYTDTRVRLDLDTILLHRYVAPDLPHSLAHVGVTWSNVHTWKADKAATEAATEAALGRYGALDTSTNARVGPPMLVVAKRQYARSQEVARTDPGMRVIGAAVPIVEGMAPVQQFTDPVIQVDHGMQALCCAMHLHGAVVDQEVRKRHERKYRVMEAVWIDKLQGLIGEFTGLAHGYEVWKSGDLKGQERKDKPLFNPRSNVHMQRLIIDEWKLTEPADLGLKMRCTPQGERSVGDAVLRSYLADMTLREDQHRILHACRRAKKARTIYGRFLSKLAPYGEARIEVEDDEVADDPEDVGVTEWSQVLAVWPDGRCRVNWNAHVTGVGRLSSGGRPSRLNFQTIPYTLRDAFIPAPGHWYFGADLASVHLRIIANMWKPPSLVDVYRAGMRGEKGLQTRPDGSQYVADDPHATLAILVFGEKFLGASGWPCEASQWEWFGAAKSMRNVAKTLRYAGAYGATVPTIHATMTRAEDDDGNLTQRTLTVSQVRAYYASWMGEEPEWAEAWDREVDMFRRYGFLLSPILGRRADFSDGEDFNQLANYRILAAEADLMGPMTIRVHNRLIREIHPTLAPGEIAGIMGQFHDQIVIEAPKRFADVALAILEDEMNVTVPGWEIPITAEAQVGTDWTFKRDPRKAAA